MRALLCCCCCVVALGAAEVDRRDPTAVSTAFLQALRQKDLEAQLGLVVKTPGLEPFLRVAVAQMTGREGGLQLDGAGLAELALLPVGWPVEVVAPAVVTAETATVDLTTTLLVKPKMLLAKQADGTWLVDLVASFKACAAGRVSMMASQVSAMASMRPEMAAQIEDAQEQPWQCQQKLRDLVNALVAYAEEHGQKLPLAAVWQDELLPYLEDAKAFVCPLHEAEECSYAFNIALSEAKLSGNWQEQDAQLLLACCANDRPDNPTFAESELRQMAGRHGPLNVVATGSQQVYMLPGNTSFSDLLAADAQATASQERLTNLVAAAKAWAKANGGRLPAAATWSDDLAPLLKKPSDNGDPLVAPGSPDGTVCTYALRAELAGRPLAELVNHRKLVLFCETEPRQRNTTVAADYRAPGQHHTRWQSSGPAFAWQAMLNGEVRQQER
ncbi:MAG: hypothetical protein IT204_07750 [Fimbriimonadaceae bacterium]|nr:hypothetical protein [Fimbriimonadaceae bacterium]